MWDLGSYACVRVVQLPREGGALSALAVGPDGTAYIAGQARACLGLQHLLACSLPVLGLGRASLCSAQYP